MARCQKVKSAKRQNGFTKQTHVRSPTPVPLPTPGNRCAQRPVLEPRAGHREPLWCTPLPGGRVVHIQQRLVEIGQVKVVLGFVILCKSLILGGRKFAQWGKVSVHVSNIKPMRLIKISIPKKIKIKIVTCGLNQLFSKHN